MRVVEDWCGRASETRFFGGPGGLGLVFMRLRACSWVLSVFMRDHGTPPMLSQGYDAAASGFPVLLSVT